MKMILNLIDSQWRLIITGVMCEKRSVLVSNWRQRFERVETY